MLVLSRKRGSTIHIGPDIRVTILEIRRNQIKVGVEAPTAIPVWRDEQPPTRQSGQPSQDPEDELSSGNRPVEVLLV